MAVHIQLEWTPNPSTLKYVVDRQLLRSGALNFTSRAMAAEKSPLALKLMDIKGVVAVMVGGNFVTVTKGGDGDWDELNDSVMETLDSHLTFGEVVVHAEAMPVSPAVGATENDVESRIIKILDNEIRPAVAMDGGDILFDRFENGVVYVHMRGSCAGCPSSTMTLKVGIEARLREAVPEVAEVVSI